MSLSYTFKSLAAFLFVLFWGWELSAVPSYPRPIRVEQPDGTTMTVRLYGDERFNYVTTVDGYNLVAENGVLYYAQVQGTKLVSTGVQAHDPMNRTNEERRILSSVSFGYPHGVAAAAMVADAGSGVAFGASPVLEDDLHLRTTAAGTNTREEFRSLVILVSFSDRDFSISNPRDAFDRMLNEEGYSENNAMGSAPRLLCGQLQRKVQPPFRCGGAVPAQPVRVLLSGQRRAVHHRRLQPGAVQRSGFSPYVEEDGDLRDVFIFYAGYNNAEATGGYLHPARMFFSDPNQSFGRWGGGALKAAAYTSELKGNTGTVMAGIGTFCHEVRSHPRMARFLRYGLCAERHGIQPRCLLADGVRFLCEGRPGSAGHVGL